MSETTNNNKSMSIVERVLAFLNITEEGKVNNFFMKLRKNLERDIKNLKKNLDTVTDNYNEKLDQLEENKQDAEVRVEEAYIGVTAEDISTNENASDFMDTYWERIERQETILARINANIESTKEEMETETKSIKEQIAERERKLSKIK